MKSETRQIDGIKIINIYGQVRISTQNEFKEIFDNLINENGNDTVIVNMNGIGYLNSAGIGIIVDSYKKFQEQNGRLMLCSLAREINKLFEVTKLNKFIEIFNNESDAIEQIIPA